MVVARPVVDVLLNDLKWLKNQNGTLLRFKSIKEAKRILKKSNFLRNHSDEELEELFYFEEASNANSKINDVK